MNLPTTKNRRVLVIDDNRAIHDDFRKILCPATASGAALDATEAALFGQSKEAVPQTQFEVDSAYQGQEGVKLAAKALAAGRPYAMAFVDVRMPPGLDGVETTQKIWEIDPDIQIVICTAYSDYSWDDMFEKLGQCDGLLILKKPFDGVEAFQLAHALTEKWWLHQQSRRKMEQLESMVSERTAELAKSETLYHSLVENVPQHIFRKDRAGRFTFGNSLFCLGLGKALAEILGKTDQDFFPAPMAARYQQDDQRVLETGQPFEGDEENRQADGKTTFVHVIKTPLRDADGQIIGVQGISWDITERKRAEAELQQKTAMLEAQVNSSIDGILVVKQEGKQSLQNQRFVDLLKIPPHIANEKSDKNRLRWVADMTKNPEKFINKVRHLYAHPDEISRDEIELKDGTVLDRYSAPVVGKEGKYYGRIWTFRDITERKQAEVIRETLLSLGTLLSEARTPKDVARSVFTVAERLWPWDAGTFDLWRAADDVAETVLCVDRVDGERREVPPIGTPGPPTPLMRRMLSHGAELILRSQSALPGAEATRFGDTSRPSATLMYVLIHRQDQPVGMLSIQSYTPNAFTKRDLQILQSLADYCGGGLERIHAEEALRESEERFSGAFEHAPIGVALVLPDGHWLQVNRALCNLIGYSESELLTRTFQDITHPGDLENDLENMRRVISGEIRTYQMEKRYVHKRGHLVTVLLDVSLIRDGQGQPRYFISQIQDITERKQAEIALRESNEKFHQLANNITDAFWIRSADMHEVHYISPAFETIWGRSVESLYANPHQWPDFILAEDRERVLGAFATFKEDSPNLTLEYRIVRPGGEIRWVSLRAAQVRDAAGKVIRLTGIVTDITERKQVEAQLFQSQKMETVGKLAGGIAHEFNSLLTVIIGQSEMLLEDLPAGSPLAANTTEIRKAADRAATLTRQLLAYGRKQFLRPEALNLNQVISGLGGVVRHLMGAQTVDVRIIPARGLHLVKADAGQIEQVIMNLAINARDAMPNGGKLTMETANISFDQETASRYPELTPGHYAMLAITDTGTGMTEEVRARAFEPFFTTKDVGQGPGLGLSTCYGIVKQSGGHISVYSEPGRSTTFKIYLPQVEVETKSPVKPRDSLALPGGTETILLVEDDPALREMAAALLTRLGYSVLAAANGAEALGLMQQRDIGHIELLFTDVVMPHMNGKELAERVTALFPHIKVLFASAYTENAIVHQGALNPGVALLQKPFTPSTLAHKLREVLER